MSSMTSVRAAERTATVPAVFLVLLAAPLSFGTTTPTLLLGDIAAGFGATAGATAWIGTVFGMAIAIGTPVLAGLIRLRGLRYALLLSTALVLAGAAAAVFAPTLAVLLIARIAQGIGGAGLVVIAMNLAGSPLRMGLVTSGISMCGAIGPLLGAWIARLAGWPLALALPVLGLVAVPAVLRGLPHPARRSGLRFDGIGALLLAVLAVALVNLTRFPVPALSGAVLAGTLLVLHIHRTPEGFVPRAVVARPLFGLLSAFGLVLASSYFALLYIVPALLARDDWATGEIGTAQLFALLGGAGLAWLLATFGGRLRMRLLACLLLSSGAAAPLLVLLGGSAVFPLAIGLAACAASSGQATLGLRAAQSAADQYRSTALGLFNLCYQLGSAFGPALAAALVFA
ncbi:MFS transporter [Sciscionella marina]|uniref:MFS transporter n=1 Tax=Sciscionella marina TaxID=508770 RepID=UPI0003AAC1F2|nr:MFS transporter [Sciscionella marina]